VQYRPSLRAFAVVGATDSLVRGVALSIYPLLMFRAWGDALVVSQMYFAVGVLSLLTGLTVPLVMRYLARRWLYSAGAMLFVLSAAIGMVGGKLITVALLCHGIATATVFVCFNAYVLDNVAKSDLSRFESLRIIYGGVGWTLWAVALRWAGSRLPATWPAMLRGAAGASIAILAAVAPPAIAAIAAWHGLPTACGGEGSSPEGQLLACFRGMLIAILAIGTSASETRFALATTLFMVVLAAIVNDHPATAAVNAGYAAIAVAGLTARAAPDTRLT
jgi:hypothetical protein